MSQVTSSSSGAKFFILGEPWSRGWALLRGECFASSCCATEGTQQMLQVWPSHAEALSPQFWPVALLSMNSQTPLSTDRLSSGQGHPFHFAYFLGVFPFVSGQGMSLFTSSEGFVLWASVGPFPAKPLSCQEVTGSLLSIVKSHRYKFS